MQIHIHPDRHVYIREGKEILYQDSIENFELDYGVKLDVLPEKYNERSYDGNLDRLADGFTSVAEVKPWIQGDDIISKVPQIVQAQQVRMAPRPPTQEEVKIKEDTDAVKAALKEMYSELDSSKITNELLAKLLRQVLAILLNEVPTPDIVTKDVIVKAKSVRK